MYYYTLEDRAIYGKLFKIPQLLLATKTVTYAPMGMQKASLELY